MKFLQLALLGITILCPFKTADGVSVDNDMKDKVKSESWIGPVTTQSGTFKYKIIGNKLATIYEMEDQCKKDGGHIASIHSKEENDFIHDLVWKTYFEDRGIQDKAGVYIHLGYHMNMREIKWLDGTPIDYTNFRRNSSRPMDDLDFLFGTLLCGTIRLGSKEEGHVNYWVMANCEQIEQRPTRNFFVCKAS
ncbi:Lectin C-type domain protein [Trichostrongylus colubriformis]|uniref:Lectin C-type domain protein n=1 Tax=Trichostrongylus colubriformis TaxID=6319 RepID=A0AAN8F752_TRICO